MKRQSIAFPPSQHSAGSTSRTAAPVRHATVAAPSPIRASSSAFSFNNSTTTSQSFQQNLSEALNVTQLNNDWRTITDHLKQSSQPTSVNDAISGSGNEPSLNMLFESVDRWARGVGGMCQSVISETRRQRAEHETQEKKQHHRRQSSLQAAGKLKRPGAVIPPSSASLRTLIPSLNALESLLRSSALNLKDERWRLSIQSENDALRRRNTELQRRVDDLEEDMDSLMVITASTIPIPGFTSEDAQRRAESRKARDAKLDHIARLETTITRLSKDLRKENEVTEKKVSELQQLEREIAAMKQREVERIEDKKRMLEELIRDDDGGGDSHRSLGPDGLPLPLWKQMSLKDKLKWQHNEIKNQKASVAELASQLQQSQSNERERQQQRDELSLSLGIVESEYQALKIELEQKEQAFELQCQKYEASELRSQSKILGLLKAQQQRMDSHDRTSHQLLSQSQLMKTREQELLQSLDDERHYTASLHCRLAAAENNIKELKVVQRREKLALIAAITPATTLPPPSFDYESKTQLTDEGDALSSEPIIVSNVDGFLLRRSWTDLRAHKVELRETAADTLNRLGTMIDRHRLTTASTLTAVAAVGAPHHSATAATIASAR